MEERDVTDRLGQPHEVTRRGNTMRRHGWRCDACGDVTRSAHPIERPSPCKRCGNISFIAVKDE
jgi:hypothetical protein